MLEIIVTSSILILVLMLFRRLFWGKISRRLQYALWILVAIRLLVPAEFLTSPFSIMNVLPLENRTEDGMGQHMQGEEMLSNMEKLKEEEEIFRTDTSDYVDNREQEGHMVGTGTQSETAPGYMIGQGDSTNAFPAFSQDGLWRKWLFGIYIAGVVFFGVWIWGCNLKFRSSLVKDRRFLGNEGRVKIYLSSRVSSPCLFGIWNPGIYMTEQALCKEERKEHTLLHEMTHYRHLDHVWAVVRSLCLVLYWFHPLVWIAARLSMADSELACDEGTLSRLGEENRESYGRTLIEMTIERSKQHRLLYVATDMINGKAEIKKRITAIALYKKPVLWAATVAVVFAVILSACTASGEKQSNVNEPQQGAETDESFVATEETDESGTASEENNDSVIVSEITSETTFTSEITEKTEQITQTEEGIFINEDGSFRLSEFEADLTGDRIKERIVFDVVYWSDLGDDMSKVTTKTLWDKLWNGTEVLVRILEGRPKNETEAAEEVILWEHSFSEVHAGNGNLAVVSYNDRKCIMLYSNLMYQGAGNLRYEIWQLMPSGTEPVLLEEGSAAYGLAEHGGNEMDQDSIDQVIQTGQQLDEFLKDTGTDILLNANVMDRNDCYLYGSTEGVINGVRRQSALEVFRAGAGGSGLELKIADYFYPEGMEPITKLPSDAEARVLAGEVLCMEISPENSTAGQLDLDGDGEKEVLYLGSLGNFFREDGWEDGILVRSDYRVRVNSYVCDVPYASRVDPVLMAFSPDGKEILLAVYDDGPSNDPETSFFRYDDTGLYPAGRIPADLRNITVENGMLKCSFRIDMIQTEWAWGYYYWNGSEILQREDEVYEMLDDTGWREREQRPLMLRKEITVFTERSEESTAILMKPQQVRNVATDALEWVLLEAKDGTRGWLRVDSFYIPSEKADVFELFDELNMAD